jgi:hypothetical protein
LFHHQKRLFSETQRGGQLAHAHKKTKKIESKKIEIEKEKYEWRPIGFFKSW